MPPKASKLNLDRALEALLTELKEGSHSPVVVATVLDKLIRIIREINR